MKFHDRLTSAALFALTTALATSAFAQQGASAAKFDTPSPSAPEDTASRADVTAAAKASDTAVVPAASQTQGNQLGEIIVTAQRRAENLERVPVAVTAISAATLQNQQITKPSELVFVTPSLQQQSSIGEVGATNFSIRGIGTNVFGPGIESSVATVYDDVTLSRPQLGIVKFFDLDNVQVLRGPQGMLFGKNASAGVVNISTRRPQFDQTTADIYAESGIHDSIGNLLAFNGNGTVNAPIGSDAAVRASVFGAHNAPIINSIGTGASSFGLTEYGGRLKFLWHPTSAFEVYVLGDYVREHGIGDGALSSRYNAPGGVLGQLQGAGGNIASPDNRNDASNAPNNQNFEAGGAQLNLRYNFESGASLTNIIAYRTYADNATADYDSSPFSLGDQLQRSRNLHQWSEELRYASPSDQRLTYQVGIYLLDLQYQTNFDQEFNLEPLFPPPAAPYIANLGALRNEHISSQSYAGFGQADFKLTDDISVFGGGRVTHDRTAGRNIFETSQFLIPLLPPGTTRNTVKKTNFSWRAGVKWQVTPLLFVYADYAKGYKGPALDETTLDAVKPEIPRSVEGGLKAELFGRKLIVNVAGFHSVYSNFQAQAYKVVGANGNFTTLNAGSLRTQGAEVDFRALPFRGFTLSGGMAYIDGIYRRFTGAPCYPAQPTGTSGRFVCLPNQTTDVSGGRIANSPRFTFNLAGEYETDLTGTGKGFIGVNVYHRSSLNYSVAPDPKTHVGSIYLLGAHAGVGAQDGSWRFELFGRNILDKRFPTYVVQNPFGGAIGDNALGGDYYQTLGSESFRTIGVAFTGHF